MGKDRHEEREDSQEDLRRAEAVEVNDASDEAAETLVATVATLGVVGVGVAVLEAALLPGVILGAAAVMAPKLMPQIGSALKPLFKSTVRGAYKISQKTREFVAETQEHVQDIVAEADAEVAEKDESFAESAPAAK